MLPEIPNEQFSEVLESCAQDVLWEAGIERPPVNAFVVAQRLGIVVARDETMLSRARFVRLEDDAAAPQPTILLAPEDRPERQHWAVAHEIGECMAHRVFAALGVPAETAPSRSREIAANHLASRLLLPGNWFAEDGCDVDWDLFDLKHRYDTASHELIARRMLDMRPPVVITLCDLGRIKWRRCNLPSRPPRMTDAEEDVWQRCHHTGEPAVDYLETNHESLGQVACWPVHEPDWRREILRTEVADFF